MEALPDLAPLGIGGALVMVIVYLLRANQVDRAQQATALEARAQGYRDEAARLEARIRRLDERIAELDADVDREQTARRAAEDRAAEADRRAAAAQARARMLTTLVEGRGLGVDSPTSQIPPVERPTPGGHHA